MRTLAPPTHGEAGPSTRVRVRRRSAAVLLTLVIGYSLVHLGSSIVRYGIVGRGNERDVYGADVRRAVNETREWQATGTLDFSQVIYPPLYYALLAPLTGLEFRIVEALLYWSQFLWYGLAILLMVKTVYTDRPPPSAYVVAAALTVNFQPLLETLSLYKVEGIECFLICWAVYAFKRRRDGLAGFLIVTAANLKYLPAMLGLYFLLKRERRVILGMLAACALYAAVLLPVFGVETLSRYVTYPVEILFSHHLQATGAEASFEIQTLSGTINRLFAGPDGMAENLAYQTYAPVPHARLAFAIAGGLKLVLAALYVAVIRRRWRPDDREAQWLGYLRDLSLTLLMIFVLAPMSLLHYAILLLPAFVWWGLVLFREPRAFPLRHKVLFGLAYGMVALVVPGGVWHRLFPPHPVWAERHSWVYFWFSGPFYGYLLLGLCAGLFVRRVRVTGALRGHRP